MTAKTKFEQLIEFVINDEEQKAHELFHDIVVEKSREIYENIMNEEDEEELDEESSGSASEDLVKEVETDEQGAMNEEFGDDEAEEEEGEEAEEEGEGEEEAGAEEFGAGEEEVAAGEGDIEDRVVDLEDKLDELMAEFEALMGDEEVAGDEAGDEFDMEPVDGDVGGDAEMGDDTADFTDTDVPMTEAVSLIKVAAAKMGDNGVQTKSPTAFNSGAAGMQGKPVRNTASESNPDGTSSYKAPTSYADKGRGDLKGANNFKNVPGKNNGSKLEAAPKPKAGDNGSNTRTPFPKG